MKKKLHYDRKWQEFEIKRARLVVRLFREAFYAELRVREI